MNRNSFLFTSIAATVLTLGFSHVLAQQEPVVKKFSLCTEDQPFSHTPVQTLQHPDMHRFWLRWWQKIWESLSSTE